MFDYKKCKKLLFKFDPEFAHNTLEMLIRVTDLVAPWILNRLISKVEHDTRLSQNICGVDFLSPVGLAAGFDKNATMIKALGALGFGFLEVGTLTNKPQAGNPKPRIKRLEKINSLQNSMGFNNYGAKKIQKSIKRIYPFSVPLGVNIGKNKNTDINNSVDEYIALIDIFKDLSDYITINISSPNTKDIRSLQNESFIEDLFTKSKNITQKPIFLKISPDLEISKAISLCSKAIEVGASGIIATNTTVNYDLIDGKNIKNGGLSGYVLKDISFNMLKEITREFYKKTTIISVGGIRSAEDVIKRLKIGASLVQVYTALIYEGPALIKNINKQLLKVLKENGLNNINEVIGIDIS